MVINGNIKKMNRIFIISLIALFFRGHFIKDDTKPYKQEIKHLKEQICVANDRIEEANKIINSKNKLYYPDSTLAYY